MTFECCFYQAFLFAILQMGLERDVIYRRMEECDVDPNWYTGRDASLLIPRGSDPKYCPLPPLEDPDAPQEVEVKVYATKTKRMHIVEVGETKDDSLWKVVGESVYILCVWFCVFGFMCSW
jgi:hypothetical protein